MNKFKHPWLLYLLDVRHMRYQTSRGWTWYKYRGRGIVELRTKRDLLMTMTVYEAYRWRPPIA